MPNKKPLLPAQPSVWQVTRLVKRQDNSLFNCVNSILDDAAFVREIALYYPTLPLLANLRCGLWYTPKPDGTCYYKSTDGHHGAWSFSTTRLNWHVAELAAKRGGAIIVDATRKGKRFPDAMSKTIPIWAAVINRAVARVRAHDARKRQRRRNYSMDASADDGDLLVPVDDTQTTVSAKQPCQPSSPKKARAGELCSVHQHQPASEQQEQQLLEQQEQQEQQQQTQLPVVAADAQATDASQHHTQGKNRPPQLSQPSSPKAPPTPERLQRSPSDTPPSSPRIVLHRRSQSMLLSPQPSLQEWLDQEEGGLSPVFASRVLQRRSSRVSTPSGTPLGTPLGCPEAFVFGAQSAPSAATGGMATAAAALASSASVGASAAQTAAGGGSIGGVLAARAASGGSGDGVDAAEVTACEYEACGPDTPRIGSWDNSSSGCGVEVPGFEDDLQHPFALSQQQQQQQDDQEPDCVCTAWALQAAAAAGTPVQLPSPTSFAFPSPDVIAECTAACSAGDASTDDGNDGSYSDCGTGSVSPQLEMPIVVLNGRSHKAEVAASILGIWRAVELEDMCDLPHNIADFAPGIVRQACSSPTSPGRRQRRQQQQQQQQQEQAGSSDMLADWGCHAGERSKAAAGPRPARLSEEDGHGEGVALPCGLAPFEEAFDEAVTAAGGAQGPNAQLPAGAGGLSAMLHQQKQQQGQHKRQQMPLQQSQPRQSHDPQQQATSSSAEPWDTQLHLPLWISAAEHAQIEARLDGWVERLFEVGADVRSLAAVLTKPLRPLWVSQASTIWVNQVAQPDELPFTPLVLVSASQPQSYQRQACRQEGGEGEQQQQQQQNWSYVYVSGAGDDEESWSRGLSPSLFWQHQRQLIAAGPHSIADVVAQLRAVEQSRASAAGAAAGRRSRSSSPARARSSSRSASGAHNLRPKGCEGAVAAAAEHAGNGAFWLGSTGIAVGSLQAAAAPGVWRHFGAVLCCGSTLHPSLQQECQAMQLAAKLAPATCSTAAQWVCNGDLGGVHSSAVSSAGEFSGAGACSSGPGSLGGSSSINGGGVLGGEEARLLWLPVQSSKHHRSSLKDSLGRALAFLSGYLAQGRRVLICDDNGQDACIGVAVALLLACYSWPEPGMQGKQALTFTNQWPGDDHGSCTSSSSHCVEEADANDDKYPQLQQDADPSSAHGGVAVTKDSVRQRLAFVSSACPSSRPTRGMLKQVFNYFEERRRRMQCSAQAQAFA